MREMISDNKVYTPSEVASCLRVSPVTISRSIRDGKLQAFRVGGQWRILGSQVVRYIESQTNLALSPEPSKPKAGSADSAHEHKHATRASKSSNGIGRRAPRTTR
jgi:excisionase family DNA binding protein